MYVFSQDIPPNTSKSAFIRQNLVLDYGIINKININIPRGVYALAGFQLMQGNTQRIPANLGAWFTGDNLNISFEIKIDITSPPYELWAKYYNEDDSYYHTITLQFSFLHNFSGVPVTNFNQLGSI